MVFSGNTQRGKFHAAPHINNVRLQRYGGILAFASAAQADAAGAQVTGQSLAISQLWAEINFFAEKKSGLRSQTMTQYHLKFYSFDDDDTWKRLGPDYRKMVETDSKQKAQTWAEGQSEMVSPPEVTQYPWGKGVTQRRRFYGEGAPDFYSYQCAYFGMAGSTRFELTVEEIADRAEADKWATKVAETAAKTSRSSISK